MKSYRIVVVRVLSDVDKKVVSATENKPSFEDVAAKAIEHSEEFRWIRVIELDYTLGFETKTTLVECEIRYFTE